MRRTPRARRRALSVSGKTPLQIAIDSIIALTPAVFYLGNNAIVDSGNAESGDQLSQWTDLSGNSRHATQATQDDQPTLSLAGSDYKLAFDAGDGTGGDSLSIPTAVLNGVAGCQAFIAGNRNTRVIGDLYSLAGSNFRGSYPSAANDSMRCYVGGAGNYAALSSSFSRSAACVMSIRYDGAGALNADRLKVFKNNVDQSAVVTYTGTIPATLAATVTPGSFARNSGGTLPSNEDIYALLVFARALSSTDQNAVDTHLKTILGWYS